jgi:hypothetical protein
MPALHGQHIKVIIYSRLERPRWTRCFANFFAPLLGLYLATVLTGASQICRKSVLDGERLWQIDFEAAECCGVRDAAQVATQPATQIWSAIEELIITLFLPQPWNGSQRGCSNTPALAFAFIRMRVPDVHTEPTGYSSPFKV